MGHRGPIWTSVALRTIKIEKTLCASKSAGSKFVLNAAALKIHPKTEFICVIIECLYPGFDTTGLRYMYIHNQFYSSTHRHNLKTNKKTIPSRAKRTKQILTLRWHVCAVPEVLWRAFLTVGEVAGAHHGKGRAARRSWSASAT